MPIHVLLTELPEALRIPVEESLSQQADMELTTVHNYVELLIVAGETQADIVVLAMKDGDLPGIATHLLDEYPQLKVLALSGTGERAHIYQLVPQLALIDETSASRLPDLIRTVIRSESP
jgi:DNA-binding NarL/FixJ family response regulator